MKLLSYLLTLVLYVDGSHFRGGIITWKSIASHQVEISFRLSFRSSYPAYDHSCNLNTIQSHSLVSGEGSLNCISGCSGSILPWMSYYCTDFSTTEDWTTGQRVISYTFPTTSDNVFKFGYGSCCWISLVEGGSSAYWQMQTTADLSIRQDTGKINSSPISAMPPIVRLQQGCYYALVIPTADDDKDVVKCRWSTGYSECGNVCKTLSGSVLIEEKCVLQYTASGSIGWYAVAIQIEDFVSNSSTVPLSSVSLQFLVNVFSSTASCQSQPYINTTISTPPTVKITLNTTFFQTIVADSGSTSISITEINTNSPIGMTKSELHKVSTGGTEWYVNVSWTPSTAQVGSHIFCYWAVNNYGQSSEQVCQTLYVAVCSTDIIANTTRASTGELPGDIVTYTCNPQHELTSGNLTRTCQSDGTWTGTVPICTIMCLDPEVILNAAKTQTGDNPNNIITYQCNSQYELTSGDLVRTCQNNGEWSGKAPTCTIMCLDPGVVLNAAKTQTGDNPNNTIIYQCNNQYELTNGNLVRICQNNGTWSGIAPTCTVMCLDPGVVSNAAKTQTGHNPRNTITYQCNNQYEATSGDLVRTCQNNGTWSGIAPICTIMCLEPSVVLNSAMTQTGHNPSNTITYQCNTQFELTYGDLIRTCQNNGTWSGAAPICTIMCLDPDVVLNAANTQTGDNPNNTITYQCNNQYELTSGNLVRICQNNGTWSGTAPTCTVMCLDPGVVSNAAMTQTGHNPSNIIIYQCNTQYELTSGDLVRTCQNNGTWSGAAPICTIMCLDPGIVLNTAKIQTGHNPSNTITYQCNTQYELTSGDLVRTCQNNGTWSGTDPICTIKCLDPDVVLNSMKTQTGDNPSNTITYKCNTQYELTYGDLVRTCQNNGTWNGTAPTCTIMCPEPVDVLQATKTIYGDNPGENVTYICDEQHELTSGNLTRICQHNGLWDGDIPICTIMCPEPVDVLPATKTVYGDNPGENVTYICDEQHELTSGNLTRICQHNGLWDGDIPICTIMCPEPVFINNSVWRKTGDNPGDIVTYTCNAQYEVTSGNLVRTCQTSGNWNGTIPVCTIICHEPDDVLSATKTVYGDNPGENVTYICNKQHEVTSGSLTRTCQTNGLWDGYAPICTIMCEKPDDILNANKTVYGDNPGEKVTYVCSTQHEVTSGSLTRTCQTTGVWDGNIPICTVMCPEPIDVLNATKIVYGDNPGENVTYTCDEQHEVTSGNLTRTCQYSGLWNGVIPVCTIMCPEPEEVYKANKTYTGNNPNDNVTYICAKVENHVIGTYSRTCLLNGSWSSDIPGCMCDPPPIVSNAVWERNGSTAYLKCNDGFYSKGNLQIHCSINSSWTSLTDKCYKESSIDFIIVASVLCFGVLSALIASAAILLKRKKKKSSEESEREEYDTEDYFNDADAENLVPQIERSVAPVSSVINPLHNARIDPQYEHPKTPTDLFCTEN